MASATAVNNPTNDVLSELVASRQDGKVHLLLAASGSVATIKIPNIIAALTAAHPDRLSIRLVLTAAASHFLAGQSAEQPTLQALRALPGVDAIYQDEDEWGAPWRRGAAILHIELRRWADLMAVVPLGANTLAKIANGLCDNLLTSVVRAWDAGGGGGGVDGDGRPRKRILVAPAMNTAMWLHPITARQIRVLAEDWGVREAGAGGGDDGGSGWFEVLRPQEKSLACGDVGDGAMKEWTEIVRIIEARLGLAST